MILKNKVVLYGSIVLVVAALLFLLYYFYTPESKNKEASAKSKVEKLPNDWERDDMTHKNIDPYGTFIFHQLLKHHNKKLRLLKRNSQYEKLDTINSQKRLYVFVGKNFDSHFKRINKILAFVGRGNDAFISAEILPKVIYDAIQNDYRPHNSFYKNVELNFVDSSLRREKPYNFKFIYKRKNQYKKWSDFERQSNYYNSYVEESEENQVQVFEMNESTRNPVFIKVQYGKGFLYLHSVPYAFNNIVMLNELGLHHAERVISCLPQRPIIYDSYINAHRKSGFNNSITPTKRTSPLQFILENRSLRWAYYILLVALLFYIIFRGKRRQQVIPAKETIENNSIEFADTMSKLYLQYGQHKYIVFQQERNFINYVRNKYYINVAKPDEESIARLAVKSGIDKDRINKLFTQFGQVKSRNHASSNDVVDIYAQIEYFYKNCK